MAQQAKPLPQLDFHGVYTAGNPAKRPRGTAALCRDFRIMPGHWLRLRGGRRGRYNLVGSPAGECRQIFATRDIDKAGAAFQFGQFKFGAAVDWRVLNVITYAAPVSDEPISTAFDGGYCLTNPAAIANVINRAVFYNGLGVRDGTNSRPPFSHYPGNVVRFFGLDAYCIGGNPTVAFAAGAGNNTAAAPVQIWVGLYHQATEHYGNAVLCGTIGVTGATGTITVSNLARLKFATHGASETSELYYVFYATIEGGAVPYLIFDAALTGPFKVGVASASASLSIASGTTNGWNLNFAGEAPFANDPPRPMKSIAYVNGRVYGVLMTGGSGSPVAQQKPGGAGLVLDFSYVPTNRQKGAVVWSRASSDESQARTLGDPNQCWPSINLEPTPNGEQPVVIAPSLDGMRVLVITSSATFMLEERSDGLHEFTRISSTHGIGVAMTFAVTGYGQMWADQRNQLVLLGYDNVLRTISWAYQSLLTGKTPTCADYLLNPPVGIDRYEVFFTDGTSVCHDFALGTYPTDELNVDPAISSGVPGEGYTYSGKNFTAACTVIDDTGKIHHLVAKSGIYTQDLQPDTGLVPTTDENFVNSTNQTVAASEINGEYRRNWDDFGDPNLRQEIAQVDLIVDGAAGAAATVEWYADFAQFTAGNKRTTAKTKAPQSATDSMYRFKLGQSQAFWHKFVILLNGHSVDAANFPDPATEGDLAANFYGSVLKMLTHQGTSENRA